MTRDGDPLQIPEDPATLRRLLPHIESAYARAGERRASEDFIHGFLKGLHRRDRNRRRERHFWLAVLVLVVAYAFLAGRTSAAPWPAAVIPSAGTVGAAAASSDQQRTGAPPTPTWSPVDDPDTRTAAPPTARPTGEIGEPASYFKPTAKPRPRPLPPAGPTLAGEATWYAWYQGEAAAGPGLRDWLGPDWRGKTVTVVAPGCGCEPIAVVLTDWCLCRDDRIIDLDSRSFAALSPLSRGVIRVQVLEGDWTR